MSLLATKVNTHVYSVCLRMTRNPAEAEDLSQQAFLQVFRKIGTFRGESGFSTWLHRVTVNIVLMHLRRKKPTEILFEDLDRTSSDGEGRHEHGASDTSMLGAIERLNLKRAIRKLPSGYKRFFFAVRHPWIPASRDRGIPGLFDGLFKIAASQGPQTTASTIARRTGASRSQCRRRVGRTFFSLISVWEFSGFRFGTNRARTHGCFLSEK